MDICGEEAVYTESCVSFLEKSLLMGDTLYYHLSLFSYGVFRLMVLVSLIL